MIVIDAALQNRRVGEVEAQGTELNAGLEIVLAEQSEHGIVMARIPLARVQEQRLLSQVSHCECRA